jgi:hypothetical protein
MDNNLDTLEQSVKRQGGYGKTRYLRLKIPKMGSGKLNVAEQVDC